MPWRIKRYSNRKLYDTVQRRYITLQDVAFLVRRGETVEVIDHDSSQDVTATVLAQIVAEQERRRRGRWPHTLLAGLVQASEMPMSHLVDVLQAFLSPEEFVNRQIHKRLTRLQALGRLTEEEVARLMEWLSESGSGEDVEMLTNIEQIASREEFDRLVAQVDVLEQLVQDLSK